MDPGSFRPDDDRLVTGNPLGYPDYPRTLERARAASGLDEALVAGRAEIGGRDVEMAAFAFGFMGGSMGEVAGERLARAFDRAAQRGVPLVLWIASGGVRMQEGMRALAQMPKLVAARVGLGEAHQPFIAVFANPTTGGVLASAGALADLVVAEEGATVGFAGPRLVQRHTGRPLEPGSHTAEAALAHGLVDDVVPRGALRAYVERALSVLDGDRPEEPVDPPSAAGGGAIEDAWEALQAARLPDRPTGAQLVEAVCDRAVALRGDRAGGDDPGVHAALARVAGRRALVLALDNRHPPGPGGYRKAVRALTVADRLGVPVVTLVDTPGADPGERSEASGVARAVAEMFEAMLRVRVPTFCVIAGEGGSGGGLAFATADVLVAFADSVFSIVAPEAAAEILWRDPSRAPEAARLLRLRARDLLAQGIADALIDRPLSPSALRTTVAYHLARMDSDSVDPVKRVARRRRRWRGNG